MPPHELVKVIADGWYIAPLFMNEKITFDSFLNSLSELLRFIQESPDIKEEDKRFISRFILLGFEEMKRYSSYQEHEERLSVSPKP